MSNGKFKNFSPISRSAIQEDASTISVRVSSEGSGKE
jgi:hypothetical protein